MGLLIQTFRGLWWLTRKGPAIATSGAAGWLAYSSLRKRQYVTLPNPFPSELEMTLNLDSGSIALHRSSALSPATSSSPVLLVHSVNAAASSYEMAPLFRTIERDRRVVAMDLPGFGHSDRRKMAYTPELMADAIATALDKFDSPVHVVALSLSSEFAARAAAFRPDRVKSLSFISPTGMGSSSLAERTPPTIFDQLIGIAPVARGLYDLLVTPPSIGYFLDRRFRGEADPGLSNYARLTSEQPDAWYAPLAFVSGRLFTPDAMANLYEPLTVPTLVLYDQDPHVDFALLPEFLSKGSGIRKARRIPDTFGLPHFDEPDLTMEALTRFWKDTE